MRGKLITVLIGSTLLAACGSDSDCNCNADMSAVVTLLAGDWLFDDDMTDCETTYSYTEDRQFTVTSLDSIQSGTFQLLPLTESDGIYFMQFNYEQDNGLLDCDSIRDVDLKPFFIDIQFPSVNVMHWVNTGDVVASFDRVVSVVQ